MQDTEHKKILSILQLSRRHSDIFQIILPYFRSKENPIKINEL